MIENLRELRAKVRQQDRALRVLVEVLAFYADPETWFAVSLLGDRPCGPIADDHGKTGHPQLPVKPGKRARKALLKVAKILKVEENPMSQKV